MDDGNKMDGEEQHKRVSRWTREDEHVGAKREVRQDLAAAKTLWKILGTGRNQEQGQWGNFKVGRKKEKELGAKISLNTIRDWSLRAGVGLIPA